jgi:hypothetical protein
VLVWTVGQHTSAFGFHDVRSIQATLNRGIADINWS